MAEDEAEQTGGRVARTAKRLLRWWDKRSTGGRFAVVAVVVLIPVIAINAAAQIVQERRLNEIRASGNDCPVRVEVTSEIAEEAFVTVEAREVDLQRLVPLPYERCFVTVGRVEVTAEHNQFGGEIRCMIVNNGRMTAQARVFYPDRRVECDG